MEPVNEQDGGEQQGVMAVFGVTYGHRMRSKDSNYGADVQEWVDILKPWNHDELCRLTAHVMAMIERVELSDFDDYPAGRENGFSSFVADLHFVLTEGFGLDE